MYALKLKAQIAFSLSCFNEFTEFENKKELLLQIHIFNKSQTQSAISLFLYLLNYFRPFIKL